MERMLSMLAQLHASVLTGASETCCCFCSCQLAMLLWVWDVGLQAWACRTFSMLLLPLTVICCITNGYLALTAKVDARSQLGTYCDSNITLLFQLLTSLLLLTL